MLWSGEEQGLLGSREYIKKHPELLEKISGVFVHDGGTNYVSGVDATPAMAADFEVALAACQGLDEKLTFVINERNGLRVGIGSDHDSFLRAGVPGFFWHQKGTAVYNRTHHTQYDTYDAAIPEYQRHSSIVIALGALGIANLDGLLSRDRLQAPPRRRTGVYFDGLTVQRVREDTVGAKAGIMEGDIVVAVDGAAIEGRRGLRRAIQRGSATKTFTIKRGDKQLDLKLVWPEPEKKKKGEVL